MGKRKSSPRLATTSSNDVVNPIMTMIQMLLYVGIQFFPSRNYSKLVITSQYGKIKFIYDMKEKV